MNVCPQQCFLVVDTAREAGGDHSLVCVVNDYREALAAWTSKTRISPVFALGDSDDQQTADTGFSGDRILAFLGPASVADLEVIVQEAHRAWLTLGLYNVLLDIAPDKYGELQNLAISLGVSAEFWTIKDAAITERRGFPIEAKSADREWRQQLEALPGPELPEELSQALAEFSPLMAGALARAEASAPELVGDLGRTADEVRQILGDYQDNPSHLAKYRALGQLLHMNAALSRFASQTFSGTTSLAENQCHFWSHSFLGIGVASLALQCVCRFVEATLGESRIPDRFAQLAGVEDKIPNLSTLSVNDPFWWQDHIGDIALPSEMSQEPLVPLIAHFSARDGFKSTLTTISAPLACVGCCNSHRWSLLTLTHEISHIVARDVLGELYPDLDSDAEIDAALELIDRDGPAANLLQEIRRFLLFSIIKMDDVAARREEPPEYNSDMLRTLLDHWHHAVEELIAHVFDFLYFYGQDTEKYVNGIWTSWGTIPNINSRVKDYVVRTLCAVLPPHLRRGQDGLLVAREQVAGHLQGVRDRLGPNTYADSALVYIASHWEDEIEPRINARLPVIKIVKSFLFSKRIATTVRSETEVSGGASEKEGYTLCQGVLETRQIRNPLRFLELYTRSREPSPGLSAWLLYTLAFCVGEDAE